MKTYTLGEVVRLGLLKNHKGEPYKHKATVLKLLKGVKRTKTPFGRGYAIEQADINRLNNRWK